MTNNHQIGTPIYVPEQRSDLPRLLAAGFNLVREEILDLVQAFADSRTCEGLLRLEEEIVRMLAIASSHVVAGVVTWLHTDKEWVVGAIDNARQLAGRPMRHQGTRKTPVRFLSGVQLTIPTPYLSEDRRKLPGRRRGVGRRGKTGTGVYPALMLLGVIAQASPALASEVAKQTVRTASFEEAHEALSERGIRLNRKTVRQLALTVGGEALKQRQARVVAAENGEQFSDEFAGKRVVFSTDGGRIRMREGGKRGPKGKKGRRRFRTPWREPKLVVAYIIDDEGKKVRSAVPLYDGTLGNADAAFKILLAELKLRGAQAAKEIVLTADGARWIWNRADELAKGLGLTPNQIVKVADFYHAVEHLTKIADLCASWSPAKRKQWVRRMRRHLKAGQLDAVLQATRDLCRGRNAKKIRVEVNYFATRRDFMRYDEFKARGIPLGSGAVESAIRRVVNLRLKGPSMFWRGPNAERMLHLRCYLKAGRWNELMGRVMRRTPSGEPS